MAKKPSALFRFERHREPLAARRVFIGRLLRSIAIAGAIVAVSLMGGMTGYVATEGMGLVDAFANAAMILSGMGPLSPLTSDAGKLFAGIFALYSGLVLVMVSGIILAPVAHRVLHSLHVPDEDPVNSNRS